MDQNSSDALMPPSSSLLYSTPSLSQSELVSHILESSGSVLSPVGTDPRFGPHQSPDLPSTAQIKHIQEFSSVTTSSSSAVDVVTSALDSLSLSDSVFLGTFSSSANATSSSEPESSLSKCSECASRSNSSDGIRGIWYYLTSSQDSSETSSRPTSSSSCLSESEITTPAMTSSSSVINLSSEPSSSADDAETTGPSKCVQKCSVTRVSDRSRSESDVVYVDATDSGSDQGVVNSGDSTSKSNVKKQPWRTGNSSESSERLAEGLREKEKVCEGAALKEKVLGFENKAANSGDVSVRGAAGLMDK